MFLPKFHSDLLGGFHFFTSCRIPLGILALHLFSFRDVVLKTSVSIQPVLSLLLKFLNLSPSEAFSFRKKGGGISLLGNLFSISIFRTVLISASWHVLF